MAIRYTYGGPHVTSKGVVVEPKDKSDAAADGRFERMGGARIAGETVEAPKVESKFREIYRGGKTAARQKPWLLMDPPMSRRTWYRRGKPTP